MTYSDDRGSGRLAQWQAPAPIATQPQPQAITPADFMAGMAALQQAMESNALALADYQQRQQAAALARYPQPQPQPIATWQAPQQWSPPQPQQWSPPQPQPNITLSPTISPIIHIEASSHSAQDNGGGGWFSILLGAFFLVPISAALLAGGGR